MRCTSLLDSNPADMAHLTPADRDRLNKDHGAYTGALKESGAFLSTDWLQPVHSATALTPQIPVRRWLVQQRDALALS